MFRQGGGDYALDLAMGLNHMSGADRVASGSAGAPEIEDEIEITPKMIEAGKAAFEFYHYSDDEGLDFEARAVKGIFKAMLLASRSPRELLGQKCRVRLPHEKLSLSA